MRKNMVATAVAVLLFAALPAGVSAAEAAPDCTQNYLLCLNDATQEDGLLWRTAMEFECGLEYFGCMRRKAVGA